ncbi:MAG: hypothetical protein C4523_07255 [Myxococcales bacterium]|nr:MAG: hypothetical protein C4523_07255 [Myxococcales bacterium]
MLSLAACSENATDDDGAADGDADRETDSPGEEEETPDLPFAPAGPDAAPDPLQPGPFPVGVMTIDLVDDSRTDPSLGGPRFVRTEIWYPAVQSAAALSPWTYDLKAEADANIDLGENRDVFMAQEMPGFESMTVRDAEMEQTYAPYPLVLFSHGAYSLRMQYLFFTAHLASHGYVVVAGDHRGNTLWDMIRDGFNPETFGDAAVNRPLDVVFLLNQMEKLNAQAGHALYGAIDVSKVGVSGHSFGGYTALIAPCIDSRLSLAVPMAPLTLGLESAGCDPSAYPAALLLMGATDDRTLAWQSQYCTAFQMEAPAKWLYELVGGGHFTFSDVCAYGLDAFGPFEIPDLENDGCSETDNIPYALAQQTIRHYAVAVFNRYLRDSSGSEAFLEQFDESPFDVVHFYSGGALPDWPEGGCGEAGK